MGDPDDKSGAVTGRSEAEQLTLGHGRSVLVLDESGDRNVEIRDADGGLMLRVRMTPEGPVVQLEAARLELVAKTDVVVSCERFEVNTTRSAVIRSQGELRLEAEQDLAIHSGEDVKLTATMIWLN